IRLWFMRRGPPRITLFPYTTLFRSHPVDARPGRAMACGADRARFAGPRHAATRAPRVRPVSPGFERQPALARAPGQRGTARVSRSEEHTSELQSPYDLVCRLLLKKN